ncbi:uncharacterized protein LOC124493743 [Dermatophagoides farinae]|uniref:uncharacterized protein LOC124493743 n=1 Tax=Dermatophagoides farinae TaxID=6954 RepID=UPI003F612290
MEHQILICNEPSPQSPPSSSTTSSSSSSLGQNHLNLHRSHRNGSHRIAIHHYQSLDQSSPTSDSSGYDSNTSIISSIHSSYGDDEHHHYRTNNRNCRKRKPYDSGDHESQLQQQHQQQLQQTKSNQNRMSISHQQQQQQQLPPQPRQRLAEEPESVISHLDQNLLDDQERILKRMLSIEQRYIPLNVIDAVYRSSTSDINEKTRFELTEWMHEVCEQYKCEPGIFSLSVNYLDRFILAKPTVPKQQLQLAGIVCMLIASKIRQCNTFDLEFLSFASDHAFTVKEILIWEQLILKELSWDVSSIIATDYLDYLLVILSNLLSATATNTCQKPNKQQQQCNRRNHRIRRYSISNHHQDDVDIGRLRKTVRRMTKNHCSDNENDDDDNTNVSSLRKRKTSIRSLNHPSKRMKSDHRQFTSRHDDDDEPIVYEKQQQQQQQHNSWTNNSNDHQSCSTSTIEAIIRRHANTFIELCSIDITFVSVEPSVIASACVATALQGLDINRNRTTTTSQSSTDMTTKTNTMMMMMMTPEQPISTTNYMITTNNTTTATNNSNSNNSRRHTTVQQANDQQNSTTTIIPNNLYEQFLLAVEKQLGIDSHCIENYAKQIDNLIRNESMTMDRNSMTNNVDDTIATVSPEITSRSSSNHINNNNTNIVPTPPTTATATAMTISIDTNLPTTLMNAHCYQNHYHQHSTVNNNTTSTAATPNNNQNYIHTTFAQVSSAKQLLLNRQQQQQQQQQQVNQQENRYIPHNNHQRSYSLLHDTTNGGPTGQMTTATWLDDLSLKTQPSLTDLLSYLEHEDRENIPIFIPEQPSMINVNADDEDDDDDNNEAEDDDDDDDDKVDQENRPPSSSSSSTNIIDRSSHLSQLTIDIDIDIDGNHHNNDDHDEGLGEDLYF